jgi:glycogen debranching enzyme
LPPTIIFSVDFLWNLPGTALQHSDFIETHAASGAVPIYCTCNPSKADSATTPDDYINIPIGGPYFAADFIQPVGVSTGKRRALAEIEAMINRQQEAYQQSIASAGQNDPILDAIESTLGWNTIYEPARHRVISPVSRTWAVHWGGFVLFDWDTFFAATLAGIGDRDLAYANAIEILREETPQGFVPNYAGPGGWESFDRSEPPVGAITVLGLYQQYHDRWFLKEAFPPLLRWNRWWSEHSDTQGYLAWGSDGDNQPESLDDSARGTRAGAILESGLDNSPMYDSAVYNSRSHLLEYADVGLMSMYIADCDALAQIADTLNMPAEAKELNERGTRYRLKLATLWNEQAGIFLNKDLHTGQFSYRLSPTNFYPMLAHAATPAQASTMVEKHLLNPQEFWGEWVIPSIARNDTAFHDQNYWRGGIWGPMNYLVYLGLRNYDDADTRQEFAQKSYNLFLKEWSEKSHVHENYNAILGSGDDVVNSNRFYHWGALLGYVEYLEQNQTGQPLRPLK